MSAGTSAVAKLTQIFKPDANEDRGVGLHFRVLEILAFEGDVEQEAFVLVDKSDPALEVLIDLQIPL